MIERSYSIHNIIQFRIKSNNIPKRLAIEYKNFETNNVHNPDFTIEIGEFEPSNEDCHIINHTYYIKENYFYCKDAYKFGKWKVQVAGLESDKTEIKLSTNFIGSLFADMFICTYIIDFFIRFKLERKGYSVIHASSMSKDNQAILFPSQSGAGKTTTAIYLAEKGYDYLGDDFVILYKGEIFSYPTPLNLFAYNLNPVIRKNLPLTDMIILTMKNVLYKITAGKIKIFTKMNPKNLPGLTVINKSNLKAVYLLAQGNQFENLDIKPDLIINSIVINQKLESYPFLKYLLEYSYVFPNSSIAQYWNVCEKNLKENLKSEIKFFNTQLPRNYSKDVFSTFKEVIECGN